MRRQQRFARSTLVWGITALLLVLVGVITAADIRRPHLMDPLYSQYRDQLRARRVERPDDAMFLFLGSSRVAMGFAPEQLPPLRDAAGRAILPFNFGQYGSGPLANLMVLRRLIADGNAPDYLAVELMPAYLKIDCGIYTMNRVTTRDLPIAWRHLSTSGVIFRFSRNRIQMSRSLLTGLFRDTKPALMPLLNLGGSMCLEEEVTPAEREKRTLWAFHNVGKPMQTFAITPTGRDSTHELVQLCREYAIRLTIVLTPECEVYRSWYREGAEEELAAFVAELRADGVNVVDGRGWLDESDTYDSHHVLRRGAEKFTRRFADEVMRPMTCGAILKP